MTKSNVNQTKESTLPPAGQDNKVQIISGNTSVLTVTLLNDISLKLSNILTELKRING